MSPRMAKPKAPWLPAQPWAIPAGSLVCASSAARDEWLAARQTLIGSSDVGKLFGASNYGDAYTVWAEKSGLVPDQPGNLAQQRGQDFEDVIVAHWATTRAEFPIVVRRQGLVRSKTHPHCGATVDRLSCCLYGKPQGAALVAETGHRCIVEVKSQANWDEWADDEVPAGFQLQGLWQLAITGRDHVHFVAMDGRFRVEHRVIERDEPAIAAMLERAERFWLDRIDGQDPPTPTGRDLDAIKRSQFRTGKGKGDVVIADDELAPHVHALFGALADEADAKARRETAVAVLQTAMGQATELTWEDGEPVATWRAGATIDGVNVDFRREHADLVDRYSVPVPEHRELDVAKLIENEPWLIERGVLRYRRTFTPKPPKPAK